MLGLILLAALFFTGMVLGSEQTESAHSAPESLSAIGEARGTDLSTLMKAFGADGFNMIQNNGEAAGQSVFHLHLHVIPRKAGDGAVGLWKPGQTTPEEMNEAAEAIRKELL